MKWPWPLVGVVTCVVVVAVITETTPRGGVHTARASAGTAFDRVVARAEVVPVDGVAEVRAQLDGRVTAVYVREGDPVQVGQLLAEIDPTSVQAELSGREAERRALAENAEAVSEGARREEQAALAAEVNAAQHELSHAQSLSSRAERLRAEGTVPETELEDAQHATATARARLDEALARLELARAGGRASEVRAARDRVAAGDAAIAEARARLAYARVVAPIAGTVLARQIDPGDTVVGTAAGVSGVLFEIADTRRTELRVEIEEVDATRVSLGQSVEVTPPGRTQVLARGRIVRLAERLDRRVIGADDARVRADGRVRAAWIALTDPLLWPIGQRFEVRIEVMARPVAVRVPRGAITVRDGRAWVRVSWPPWPLWTREHPVELGLADDSFVEVHGLALGATVRVLETEERFTPPGT